MTACTRPGAEPDALHTSLEEPLAGHPEFRNPRVYYG